MKSAYHFELSVLYFYRSMSLKFVIVSSTQLYQNQTVSCYIYANYYCQGAFPGSGRANLPGTRKETIAESLWKRKHYEMKMGEDDENTGSRG